MATYNAGVVTAYGSAVQGGYSGTYEQFCAQMANLGSAVSFGVVADAYSASSTYAKGDLCIYNGALYECNTTISTAETWTAAHWTAVTVGDAITDLKSDLNDRIAKPSSPTTGQFLKWSGSAWVASDLPVYSGGVS